MNCPWDCKFVKQLWTIVWRVLKISEVLEDLSHDPPIPLLGIPSKQNKNTSSDFWGEIYNPSVSLNIIYFSLAASSLLIFNLCSSVFFFFYDMAAIGTSEVVMFRFACS